jgi:hypothetical protein
MAVRERRVVAGFELELVTAVPRGDGRSAGLQPVLVEDAHVEIVVAMGAEHTDSDHRDQRCTAIHGRAGAEHRHDA